ncbi:MAG: hypothetical protein HC849_18615 [Oscillatoriales cyanobacterium RU_3_3]|nr:hypothetical protein [Microcoleus sp. SU_5_6]NJM61753.1 hypothetical protein [Oscillatoriales cyanobacterium RU_3_3]NJR24765.1 hypothetical protein [Richelia sp. CSU_2_1]
MGNSSYLVICLQSLVYGGLWVVEGFDRILRSVNGSLNNAAASSQAVWCVATSSLQWQQLSQRRTLR